MHWPTIDQISIMAPLPDGYRYEKLARSGIPALIAGIKLWHPDIAVGGRSCYLAASFYNNEVAPGVVKRVFEAVYTKVLVPEAELLRPDPRNLTPAARALFNV